MGDARGAYLSRVHNEANQRCDTASTLAALRPPRDCEFAVSDMGLYRVVTGGEKDPDEVYGTGEEDESRLLEVLAGMVRPAAGEKKEVVEVEKKEAEKEEEEVEKKDAEKKETEKKEGNFGGEKEVEAEKNEVNVEGERAAEAEPVEEHVANHEKPATEETTKTEKQPADLGPAPEAAPLSVEDMIAQVEAALGIDATTGEPEGQYEEYQDEPEPAEAPTMAAGARQHQAFVEDGGEEEETTQVGMQLHTTKMDEVEVKDDETIGACGERV